MINPPNLQGSVAGSNAELRGTYNCPICDWPEPHSHGPSEIAQRPAIDGVRKAFEERMVDYLRRPEFGETAFGRHHHLANRVGQAAQYAREHGDWAYRMAPAGPYHNEKVQTFWEVWLSAWLAARKVQS